MDRIRTATIVYTESINGTRASLGGLPLADDERVTVERLADSSGMVEVGSTDSAKIHHAGWATLRPRGPYGWIYVRRPS